MKENYTEYTIQHSQAQVSVICKHKSSLFKMQLFHLVDCDPELDSRGQSGASFSCFWVFPSNSQLKVLNGSTQHFLKYKTEDNLTSVIYLLEVFSEAMIFHSCLGL